MEPMEDVAEIAGIGRVRTENTRLTQLRHELLWSDAAYKLR